MEPGTEYYIQDEYMITPSGNKVHRNGTIVNGQKISVEGRTIIQPKVTLRGDIANISTGRYCFIGQNTQLRPSSKKFKGETLMIPMQIGSHVSIGKDCTVEAASIGSFVQIGNGCTIGKRCILKDCCQILEGSVLSPDTVVPPFAIFGGCPAAFIGELPECTAEIVEEATIQFYNKFVELKQ